MLREGKKPFDKRTPFSPKQIVRILNQYPEWSFYFQPSLFRCFSDEEYVQAGATLSENLDHCDYIFGIKEVPIEMLQPDKNYFFFSHTIKLQPHNQTMFKRLIELGATLYDYEVIVNESGERLVAFGQFAGIVGAYNALRMIAKTWLNKTLPAASETVGLDEIYAIIGNENWPSISAVVTGSGRVGNGIRHMLEKAQFIEVKPDKLLNQKTTSPRFTMLRSSDYHEHKSNKTWDSSHFYIHPEEYISTFEKFTKVADVFIAGAYWNPKAPKLFSFDSLKNSDFNIRVISDVTCDMDGSVPTTIRPSSIDNPFYDVDKRGMEHPAFSGNHHVHVCAVDNLPTELPADASEAFGEQLIQHVLPELGNPGALLERSAILKQGELSPRFSYMRAYGLNRSAMA